MLGSSVSSTGNVVVAKAVSDGMGKLIIYAAGVYGDGNATHAECCTFFGIALHTSRPRTELVAGSLPMDIGLTVPGTVVLPCVGGLG